MTDPVVIASYARTPMGPFQGALSGATSTQLGVVAVKAALERRGDRKRGANLCTGGGEATTIALQLL
ncbi:hypothetical protein sphantq_00645 [Sphingobium sp. AntQ-1]|nr:hypothetical protein sphantq_00645 [Sphingobium sp. AntQ-1]